MLLACENKYKYIVPADFNIIIPDSTQISNGITAKEFQNKVDQFIQILQANTIDHKIPDITICDLEEKSINLKEQLSGIKLIIASSLTCAWNMEGLLADFPKTNQLIDNPIDKSEIIVLIQR